MKKNLIKFLITVSILLTTFNANILAQSKISGEKLEKLLIENHIIIFNVDVRRDGFELNFNTDKTYKSTSDLSYSYTYNYPSSGTWEIVGFGKSNLLLKDIHIEPIQLFFGEDGNIYDLKRKLYSYRLENKKERINIQAKVAEEKRIAEELRLKKIEEEKRQLAIKREQERIKAEQERNKAEEIKRNEEKRKLELEEYVKKQKEEEIKRQKEEQLYNNILFLIGIAIVIATVFYINKFHKDKVKNLYKNIKNLYKNIFPNKESLNKNIKSTLAIGGLNNKPLRALNLKDFNIGKSTLFRMTKHNSFKIKFKKNIFKEDFLNFLNKNSVIFNEFFTKDSKEFDINFKRSFRYEWEQNYKYAEKITNLINQKFSSLVNFTNDEIFHYKEWLSEELQNNGKITFLNKVIMWTVIPITGFILWSNIYYKFISDERFLTADDYIICQNFGDPYGRLRKSKDPFDHDTYKFRYNNCIKEKIAIRKPYRY